MAQRIKRWRISWTEPARDDLHGIFQFIRRDNPTAARSVIRDIQERVGRLTRFPLSGREVPELTGSGLREVIAGNYRAIYRLVDGTVEILAIVHSRRKIGK